MNIKDTIKVDVVAGVVLKKNGKYLLLQEKQPIAYGLWNFPAGKVDTGESIEDAAIREAKEESGYDVKLIKQLIIFHSKSTDVVKHAFEAEIIGGELNFPNDEILDAKWFTFDEIKNIKDQLRGNWILESISILENNGSDFVKNNLQGLAIKELSDFVDWTLNKGRYPTSGDYSMRERCFSQTMKISEEVGELNEQVLGKFGGQRLNKMDKISDEKLKNELADVIFSTIRLARMMNLDVNEILNNKMEILKERFGK